MTVNLKAFTVLIALILCVSLISGAFALYSTDGTLDITFSGEVVDTYQMKVFGSSGERIATYDLTRNIANTGTEEYLVYADIDQGCSFKFYLNDSEISYSYDTYSSLETNSISVSYRYEMYLKKSNSSYSLYVGASYYLVGSFNNWELLDNYKLSQNPNDTNELMILGVQMSANDEFKVRYMNNYYGKNSVRGGSNYTGTDNIMITADGTYNIYFKLTETPPIWIGKNE